MASLGEEPEFTSSAASLKESVILFSDSLLSPCVAIGFGLAVIFVAMLVAIIVHTFNYQRDFHIPVNEVTATEHARTQLLARHV